MFLTPRGCLWFLPFSWFRKQTWASSGRWQAPVGPALLTSGGCNVELFAFVFGKSRLARFPGEGTLLGSFTQRRVLCVWFPLAEQCAGCPARTFIMRNFPCQYEHEGLQKTHLSVPHPNGTNYLYEFIAYIASNLSQKLLSHNPWKSWMVALQYGEEEDITRAVIEDVQDQLFVRGQFDAF